jgi:ribonuclease J
LSHPTQLQFVALGGLGEFGMNLMVYRWGEDCIVVDAGVMFPGEEHLGINVVIPDLSYLETCGTIHGVVLTHGHEDHVGALPYLLSRHDAPVYASPYTLGLVRHRLAEHEDLGGAALRRLDDRPVTLGPFEVEALPVAHSIPQSRMLLVRTPLGNVLHATDFKFDPDPVDGVGTDRERLARFGREGVLVVLSDSTNADRPGTTPGERTVAAAIEPLVASATGRVFVTTFASHVHRIQLLGQVAARHGRKLALVGASLERHAGVAEGLGLLPLSPGSHIPADELADMAPERVLIVASGSQGEPMSALARIAVGKHRQAEIATGDLVIHSGRVIPGNEKSIARMINHLLRRGAEVVTAADAPVHVSGHAAADELRELLRLVRPRFLVPIHGEYRQLAAHARLAADIGIDPSHIQLADSGDVVAVSPESISIVDRVHVGQVFIDATLDEVDLSVLRDRRRLAGDGIVVPVVAVHRESGAVNGYPEIMTRGFVPIGEDGDRHLMAEARRVVAETLADATPEERTDEGLLRVRIQSELRRFLRRRTNRRPLVIPVILEL